MNLTVGDLATLALSGGGRADTPIDIAIVSDFTPSAEVTDVTFHEVTGSIVLTVNILSGDSGKPPIEPATPKSATSSAPSGPPASEKQVSYARSLLESKLVDPDLRKKIQAALDRGLTKFEATEFITSLKELPWA